MFLGQNIAIVFTFESSNVHASDFFSARNFQNGLQILSTGARTFINQQNAMNQQLQQCQSQPV